MTPPDVLALKRESRDTAASRRLVLVHITNLYDLLAAYGAAFYREAGIFIKSRLETIGNPKPLIFLNGPYVFVDLGACRDIEFHNRDTFCERINALLAFGPVTYSENEAFLRIETTFIDRNDKDPDLTNDCQPPHLKSRIWAASTPRERLRTENAYRADMALALRLFSQLTARTLVLAFQPIVSTENGSPSIYWESLLRRRANSSASEFSSCSAHIGALERLGLIGRLDRSVLWAVLGLLSTHPQVRIGCNISAQSLKFDCWWRLVFDALQRQPNAASRLVIEITETSSITQDDETIALLQAVRALGCKIAIDDMGSGYSTLDFVVRSRPDFIKIDKAYLHAVSSARSPPSQSLLRNLTQLCADLSPCVITEGIESAQDRADAIAAGTHGLQGYHVEQPNMLPYWLDDLATVHDAYEPGHPSHSRPSPASPLLTDRAIFLNPRHR